jgi:hypothetical protein
MDRITRVAHLRIIGFHPLLLNKVLYQNNLLSFGPLTEVSGGRALAMNRQFHVAFVRNFVDKMCLRKVR